MRQGLLIVLHSSHLGIVDAVVVLLFMKTNIARARGMPSEHPQGEPQVTRRSLDDELRCGSSNRETKGQPTRSMIAQE